MARILLIEIQTPPGYKIMTKNRGSGGGRSYLGDLRRRAILGGGRSYLAWRDEGGQINPAVTSGPKRQISRCSKAKSFSFRKKEM